MLGVGGTLGGGVESHNLHYCWGSVFAGGKVVLHTTGQLHNDLSTKRALFPEHFRDESETEV